MDDDGIAVRRAAEKARLEKLYENADMNPYHMTTHPLPPKGGYPGFDREGITTQIMDSWIKKDLKK